MANPTKDAGSRGDTPRTVKASPSKRFFVEMLTRDIDLKDAILDLLDNCVDGIVRTKSGGDGRPDEKNKYEGFWAKIHCDEKRFVIQDNCGGIPKQVLIEKAFKLGRGFDDLASEHSTVGIYGIGMKRAIFKMGFECVVDTRHKKGAVDEAFEVSINANWMKSDDLWELPLKAISLDKIEPGTRIEISTLRDGVSRSFTDKSSFISLLRDEIATHYSRILEMGFKVTINEVPVKPKSTKMLMRVDEGIAPFVFTGEYKDVSVDLVVGLYREFPSEKDEEDELTGDGASKPKAGWTIVCNDRVVLFQDTSILTGWGDAGVPSYHAQFSSIAGVVTFQSKNVEDLPLTTTKRGLEASSELYLQVKTMMRDGLKHFTSFTHHWKSPTPERKATFGSAKLIDVSDVVKLVIENSRTKGKQKKVKSAVISARGELKGERFVPELPKPETESSDLKSISFKRKSGEIQSVSTWIFGASDKSPKEVGEKCFELQLAKTTNI